VIGNRLLIVIGSSLMLVLGLAALAAPWIAPHDPLAADPALRLQPPSPTFPFGTDQIGRCVLSRLLWGARLSLGTAAVTLALTTLVGMVIGLAATFGGRFVDRAIGVAVDAFLALPGMMLTMVLAGLAGPSTVGVVLGLTAASWAWWARLVRSLALSAREQEYVLGARAVGVHGPRLLLRYILPQLRQPLLAAFALRAGWVIIAISALGFLGLGIQPPAPEWGAMLQEARLHLATAPWLMLAPGVAVTAAVLACNLVAEGAQHLGERPPRELL